MIKSLLQSYKRIYSINNFLLSFSLGLFAFSIFILWENSFAAIIAIGLATVSVTLGFRSQKYLNINQDNFLEHINRHFEEYQESAQLLQKESELTGLQVLQKQKIQQQFQHDLESGRMRALRPELRYGLPIILIIFSLINFYQHQYLQSTLEQLIVHSNKTDELTSPENDHQTKLDTPFIVAQTITIIPPAYTGLDKETTEQLDFDILQGAAFFGAIEFSRKDLQYFYTRSGKSAQPMALDNSRFIFKDVAEQSSLYKFSYQLNGELIALDGIYSVSLIRDLPAKISILEPRSSLIEFAKSDSPQFTINADIIDDFGVNDVTILASVAKGSGESVKFRDKQFKFSWSNITAKESRLKSTGEFPKRANYQRAWKLSELQMEPGDEAYFSLLVLDNKQPQNQLSKSKSLVVRWLDEEEIEMGLDGMQIRFVPEYFRSQRQIIIETEQLIADEKDLSKVKFEEISTDLGASQSDLKQKYGQYLGDEFGEGQGAQFGLADGYHGGETMSSGEATAGLNSQQAEHLDDHKHADQHNEEHNLESEHQHDDVADTSLTTTNDLSGAQQLIQQFGHNHSSIEVAPLSEKDPKTWMKMAVNEMWQAEMYLMISDPAKALAYEYNAYKYLKLARQAERVYAKRLGFEPPPVSEERRLTGELKEILEYNLSATDRPDNQADSGLFSTSYQLLNKMTLTNNEKLNENDRQLFSKLSKRLLELSEDRPVLIKYAAIAEKIYISKTIRLKNCANCINDLKTKLWQLLPVPLSRPSIPQHKTIIEKAHEVFYLKSLSKVREQS